MEQTNTSLYVESVSRLNAKFIVIIAGEKRHPFSEAEIKYASDIIDEMNEKKYSFEHNPLLLNKFKELRPMVFELQSIQIIPLQSKFEFPIMLNKNEWEDVQKSIVGLEKLVAESKISVGKVLFKNAEE